MNGCASWEQSQKLEWYRAEVTKLHELVHSEMVRADENEIRCERIEKRTIERCSKIAYDCGEMTIGDAIHALILEVFPVKERERRSWQNAIE